MIRFANMKYLFLFFTCLAVDQEVYSQCTGCVVNLNSSPSNITVNTGNTICINPGASMTGEITMNGGVLCNRGTIYDLKMHGGRGTIINNGTINDNEDVVSLTGNYYIYGNASSSLNFSSIAFNFISGDSIYFNIANGGSVYFPDNLHFPSKKLSVNNSGLFKMDAGLNISGAPLLFINNSTGTVTIAEAINLSNTGNKVISNSGYMEISNDLNNGGTGSSSNSVIVSNSGTMVISGNVTAVTFTNNGSLQAGSFVQSGGVTINNGDLNVGSFQLNSGTLFNNKSISCNDNFTVSSTFINNDKTTILANFVIKPGATVNNRSVIDVRNDFSNTGKFKFGQQALLLTKNYYNLSTDTIIGSSDPVGGGTLDTTSFARVIISGYSKNTGHLSGKMIIYDQSLTTTTQGAFFDEISSIWFRGNWVFPFNYYETDPIRGGPRVVVNPFVQKKLYNAAIEPSATNIACGFPATLKAEFRIPYSKDPILPGGYSTVNAGNYYLIDLPNSSYVWQPGGMTGPLQTVNPLSTTTYTLTIYYMGYYYTSTVTVNVTPITINFGGSSVDYAVPDVVTFNPVVSGATPPLTYLWSPNQFFTNGTTNTQQNPQVKLKTSFTYNLLVTDVNGCTAITPVDVIAHPYAPLNKTPDGGYYKLFNNKMLFKYDGQYALTSLNYKVYNSNNSVVASNAIGNISTSLIVNSGDNRYYLNAAGLSTGYYTLEITNEKNEKLYLRFVR